MSSLYFFGGSPYTVQLRFTAKRLFKNNSCKKGFVSMSSDDEALGFTHRNALRMVRGPSIFDAKDLSCQPSSPRNARHPLRHTDSHSPFGGEGEEHGNDGIEFDVDEASPTLGPGDQFPPDSDAGVAARDSTEASVFADAATEEYIHPTAHPVLPLPSAMPRSIQRGLGMRDIVSDVAHLWLMHQIYGHPVRVRMFPQGVTELVQYIETANLCIPRYEPRQHRSRAHRSRNRRLSTTEDDGSTASRPSSGSTGTSTSSTTSASSKSSDRASETCWIDFQSSDQHEIELLLGLFRLSTSTVECVVEQHPVDHVEHFPAYGYVFVNIACQGIQSNASIVACGKKHSHLNRKRSGSVGSISSSESSSTRSVMSGDLQLNLTMQQQEPVVVSCIVFSDWILTIHREPFEELGDLVKQIHLDFTLKKKSAKLRRCGSSAQGVDSNTMQATAEPPHAEKNSAVEPVTMRRMMRPAWILCTLVDFVVSNFLPDPTPLLGLVDDVEARVMLLANVSNQHQQRILGQRIAWLRRAITTHRRIVNSKEQLLAQLLLPAMRTSFIARRSMDADVYVYCQKQIAKVAERIDGARDVLQSASSNFAAAGQLRMARSSQALEHRMHLMAHITTVLLPPALVAGMWGMNVTVPFMSDHGYSSVRAFWAIMGIIVVWLILALKTLVKIARDVKATSANAQSTWDADQLFGTRIHHTRKKKVKEVSAWCCVVE